MSRFPFRPMVAILVSVMCQMMAQFGIFSYVGYMVKDLGVVDDKDKAGYYAGILSSGFMIGRTLTSIFWGWFADRYGRRMVILFGLSSTIAVSVAFGLSPTFWWAFSCRFFLGASDGVLAVSKALVSEICGKDYEIVGMGALASTWSLGLVVGTGLGGILAEPATNFPSAFSESGIFGRFPFLLPNIFISGFGLVALPLVLLFVPGYIKSADESNRENTEDLGILHATEDKPDTPLQQLPQSSSYGGLSDGEHRSANDHKNGDLPEVDMAAGISPRAPSSVLAHEATPFSPGGSRGCLAFFLGRTTVPFGLLEQSNIRVLLLICGTYSFLFTGFDEVFALWALSSVSSGGLDWTTQQIGQVILVAGAILFLFEMVSVPCITARLGIQKSQRFASLVEVPAFMLFPMLARLRGMVLLEEASVALLFAVYACSNWMTIAVSLAINNSTEPARRGELNGMVMTVDSVAKVAGPAAFSALFAFSIDGDHPFPFDVHLVWFSTAILRFMVGVLAWNAISDGKGHGEQTSDVLERVKLNDNSIHIVGGLERSSEAVSNPQTMA